MATITGVVWPLRVDGGNLAIASDAALIAGHIRHMFAVPPPENPMRRAVGIPSALFDSVAGAGAIAVGVGSRLRAAIPEATFAVSADIREGGELFIQNNWSAFDTDQTDFIEVV
jgi:hypothetical protein